MKTSKRITQFVFAAVVGLAATRAGIVQNPSFESNYNDTWPHYSTIDNWTGGSGVNKADGPFHNGGTPVPDRQQVAFIQGSANLAQDISGLVAGKRYVIQFLYDARGCCGGSIDLQTKIDGTVLDNIANVKPVTGGASYNSRSVAFTAGAETANLMFTSVSSGDATVLIDGVTVVQRDDGNVTVINPSFEASGDVPDTGLLVDDSGNPAGLAGWVATGQYGINISGAGPYADNGTAPDQDHVLFLQGPSSVSQTVGTIVGKNYQLTVAYNAKSGNSPHIQIKVGDTVLFEETVAAVGGTVAYKTKTVTFTATDVSANVTIAQTAEGDQFLLVDDVRLVGEAPKEIPPTTLTPAVAELSAGEQADITLEISADALAVKDITIGLQTDRPGVVRLMNATGGLVSSEAITFTKGSANKQTVKIQGIARGTAHVQISDGAGLPIKNQVLVTVIQDFIKNPSFESTDAPGGVGYGPIAGWTGGSGINNVSQPFAAGGIIPDRAQVAFQQGAGTISQTVHGLIPGKNYWLQFFYNLRNCCGTPAMDVSVKLAGKELTVLTQVVPSGDGVPYYFANISFVADGPDGLLEFTTTPTDDATFLLDGVTIVQRDPGQIVVKNPSFEASGSVYPFPGYFGAIAGWDVAGGGRGVNIDGEGPFTDNGRANAGDDVLFMQGNGSSVSQNLTGLTSGQKYTVAYLVNARTGGGPEDSSYVVSFNDNSLLEEAIQPVGGANPYMLRQVEFTADDTQGALKLQGTTPSGDHTILLDDVYVIPSSAAPFIISQPGNAFSTTGGSATFRVVAIGGGTLTYQWKRNGQPIQGATADTLQLDNITAGMAGSYTVEVKNSGGPTTSDAGHLDVLDSIPGVFNTGVDSTGAPLEDGAVDPHYQLVQNANDATSHDAIVPDSTVFPLTGPWFANDDVSKWIGPTLDPANPAGGDYVYRMNLDLTGYDPASVVLGGSIASDNDAELWVNGSFVRPIGSGFAALSDFTVTGVFKAGSNQVDFKVNNAGAGPTGLRLENIAALGTKTTVNPNQRISIARNGQSVRLSWSASSGLHLQKADRANGPWTDSTLPTQVNGDEMSATETITGIAARFYQLAR